MRLIDADKLLEGEHFILKCKSEFGITEMDVFRREVIDNAPTIEAYPFEQVQELVDLNQQFAQEIENLKKKLMLQKPQGKWIDTDNMEEYWAEEYQCSICGAKNHYHNFCPNCGAKMKDDESGGAEDE